ncbi:uncharacterized protein KY384_008246 [Bacidia gigantensis]|uniref:uncharacterized protein n=1 Tax=Bacidia gigantensis TaxID=2732470 RepID=UPI001D044B7D|nr:uncharacterized protein KY384_008246 [Bacidia gigantensis]KAG8526817.1 hypothetical protein KY384_008246 [Bacidia gigantensis]
MSIPGGPQEDEEDDYLTMTVPEPQPASKFENSAQRTLRHKREAAARANPKSKADLAAEAETARQKALSTALPTTSSKGAQMMAKLGYRPGSTLGKEGNVNARAEPIGLEMKEGREGVGLVGEQKRKFREEVAQREGEEKRRKEEEGGYRERMTREREEKRTEGMWWGGMKVLEGLVEEEEAGGVIGKAQRGGVTVPLLYRPLVMDRRGKERDAKRRHAMIQSLSRNQMYDDPEEDEHDRQALGKDVEDLEEDEEADEELDEYVKLTGAERLEKVVKELRGKWFYCFWCKHHYSSGEEMEDECPGETEDEHGLLSRHNLSGHSAKELPITLDGHFQERFPAHMSEDDS